MFYINKMKLTKKHKGILEKACKRSSPMVVRKQLLSAFGAGFQDDYDSDATVHLWGEEPVQAEPEINPVPAVPADELADTLEEIIVRLNTTSGRVIELEGSVGDNREHLSLIRTRQIEGLRNIDEMRIQLDNALQHIRQLHEGRGNISNTVRTFRTGPEWEVFTYDMSNPQSLVGRTIMFLPAPQQNLASTPYKLLVERFNIFEGTHNFRNNDWGQASLANITFNVQDLIRDIATGRSQAKIWDHNPQSD